MLIKLIERGKCALTRGSRLLFTVFLFSGSRKNIVKKLASWIWGYDFFVSYHWDSGGQYAVSLVEVLREEGFDCFLDRAEFAMGDDWQTEADRALRNTSRLVVIATYDAITRSVSVAHEVSLFSKRRHHIIPIVFVNALSAAEPFANCYTQTTSIGGLPSAVDFLKESQLFIKEDESNLQIGPSNLAIKDLVQSRGVLRRRSLRQMLVSAIITVLAVSAIVAALFGIQAERERVVAERRLSNLEELTEAMVSQLHDIVQELPGSVRHRELIVHSALPYLDNLRKEKPDDEATLRSLAIGYLRLGDVLGHPEEFSLGKSEEALATWHKAEQVVNRLVARFPVSDEYMHLKAILFERYGLVDLQKGRVKEAMAKFKWARKLLPSTVSNVTTKLTENWTIQQSDARILTEIGDIQLNRNEPSKALTSYEEACRIAQSTLDRHEDNRMLYASLASCQERLAKVYLGIGQTKRALSAIEKIIALRELLEKDEPNNAVNLARLANLYQLKGDAFRNSLNLEAARASYHLGIDVRRRLLSRDSQNVIHIASLATDLERLGATYSALDRWKKAAEIYEESKSLRRRLVNLEPSNEDYLYHLAIAKERLADVWRYGFELSEVELVSDVEKPYLAALAIRNNLNERHPNNILYRWSVAVSEQKTGRFYFENKTDTEHARHHLTRSLDMMRELYELYPDKVDYGKGLVTTSFLMATILIQADGGREAAMRLQRDGLAVIRRIVERYPERFDLRRTLLVAESEIGNNLEEIANDKADREALMEALEHFRAAQKVLEKVVASGAKISGVEGHADMLRDRIGSIIKRLSE